MEERIKKSRERISYFRGVLTAVAVMSVIYFVSLVLPIGGYAQKPGTLQALRKAKEIERVIQNNYLEEIDEKKQTEVMFLGQVAGLEDEYSTYYTPEEYKTVRTRQSGSFMGIGISIAESDDENKELVIVSCLEGYPAEQAGVQEQDVILAVNGKSTEGMTAAELSALIQASEDDKVVLKLRREGEEKPLELEMEMTEIETVSVSGEMLDSSIGYISITQFTAVTAGQFKKTYGELQLQGMKKLIIDLRDNPGGLVSGVCETLSQILPSGVIVYTIDKNGNRTDETCDGLSEINIPLVVLVNGESASASEIFAGAVQDYEKGLIVGETTFGKGIVQETFRLSDGSYLKLTVSKYYTPNGNDIHGKGITPDVEVKAESDSEKDIQLDKALELIEEMKTE